MAASWQELTLDNVCTKITDGAHHSPKSVDLGKPMASVKDMTPFGIQLDSCRLISEEDFSKLVHQGCKPQVDDILIAKDGNSALDTVCRVRGELDAVLLSSVAILRPDKSKIIPDFLRLYLDAEPTRRYLKASSISGAAIPRVILKDFKRAKIRLPNISDQIAITDVVNSYDLLIENNNRRIAILEEMAQSLYREWFVKFRFPGHEQCQMVDSPLGLIPEGWTVEKLEDLTTKIGSGATPKGGKGAYKTEGTPLIRSLNIYDGNFITKDLAYIDDDQAGRLKNTTVQSQDVLLNITGASVARCSIVPTAFTPARVNQHVAIIRPIQSEVSAAFILYSLISAQGKSRLLSLAQGGATREALTKSHLENFEVVLPSKQLLDQFNKLTKDTVTLKEALFLKNENLKKQRDLLLPKLISGQLDPSKIGQGAA